MGWLIRERRGPAWKHGWTRQTIDSMSLPPMPVVTLFGIVLLLLWLSFHINYTRQMERTVVSLKLLLLLVPLLLIVLARWLDANRGRLVIPLPDADPDTMHRVSRTPWGVALLVGLVLVAALLPVESPVPVVSLVVVSLPSVAFPLARDILKEEAAFVESRLLNVKSKSELLLVH